MAALVGAAGGRSVLFGTLRGAASTLLQSRTASLFSPAWRQLLKPCLSSVPAGHSPNLPGAAAAPWALQQVRPKARGNEYQPSNLKRKHKHGWIKRIREASGIDVILRRMLKGRKSLTH